MSTIICISSDEEDDNEQGKKFKSPVKSSVTKLQLKPSPSSKDQTSNSPSFVNNPAAPHTFHNKDQIEECVQRKIQLLKENLQQKKKKKQEKSTCCQSNTQYPRNGTPNIIAPKAVTPSFSRNSSSTTSSKPASSTVTKKPANYSNTSTPIKPNVNNTVAQSTTPQTPKVSVVLHKLPETGYSGYKSHSGKSNQVSKPPKQSASISKAPITNQTKSKVPITSPTTSRQQSPNTTVAQSSSVSTVQTPPSTAITTTSPTSTTTSFSSNKRPPPAIVVLDDSDDEDESTTAGMRNKVVKQTPKRLEKVVGKLLTSSTGKQSVVHVSSSASSVRLSLLNNLPKSSTPVTGVTKSSVSSVPPLNTNHHASIPSTSFGMMAAPNTERKVTKHMRIKILEKKLETLEKRIIQYAEQEVTLDDMNREESAYIQEAKLKEDFVRTWKKYCKLMGEDADAAISTRKKVKVTSSPFPEINREVERYINRTGSFPNLFDIKNVCQQANNKYHLDVKLNDLHHIAVDVFTEVGRKLQKYREKDLRATSGNLLTDLALKEKDPALGDQELKSKLKRNRKIAKKRTDEVFSDFVRQQYDQMGDGGNGDGDGDSGEDDDDDSEKEYESLRKKDLIENKKFKKKLIQKKVKGRQPQSHLPTKKLKMAEKTTVINVTLSSSQEEIKNKKKIDCRVTVNASPKPLIQTPSSSPLQPPKPKASSSSTTSTKPQIPKLNRTSTTISTERTSTMPQSPKLNHSSPTFSKDRAATKPQSPKLSHSSPTFSKDRAATKPQSPKVNHAPKDSKKIATQHLSSLAQDYPGFLPKKTEQQKQHLKQSSLGNKSSSTWTDLSTYESPLKRFRSMSNNCDELKTCGSSTDSVVPKKEQLLQKPPKQFDSNEIVIIDSDED